MDISDWEHQMGKVDRELVRQFAVQTCLQVCGVAIDYLKSFKATLSGEDSGLSNVWEEICVQVQGEETAFWDAYEAMMMVDGVKMGLAEKSPHELSAIWLQTQAGTDWYWGSEGEEPEPQDGNKLHVPVIDDDVIDHICTKYVRAAVLDEKNQRVARYLEAEFDYSDERFDRE